MPMSWIFALLLLMTGAGGCIKELVSSSDIDKEVNNYL
jgi:hypothetical protein